MKKLIVVILFIFALFLLTNNCGLLFSQSEQEEAETDTDVDPSELQGGSSYGGPYFKLGLTISGTDCFGSPQNELTFSEESVGQFSIKNGDYQLLPENLVITGFQAVPEDNYDCTPPLPFTLTGDMTLDVVVSCGWESSSSASITSTSSSSQFSSSSHTSNSSESSSSSGSIAT